MEQGDPTKLSRRINPIAKFAVERRVTMGMAVLGILVLGYLSLQRLPLEFLPDMSRPSMWVQAPYNSSSPEEVERLIARPLEDILGTINGIDPLSVRASASSGSVSLSFKRRHRHGYGGGRSTGPHRSHTSSSSPDLRRIFIRRFQSTDMPVFRFQIGAELGPGSPLLLRGERTSASARALGRRRPVDSWGLNQRQVEVRDQPRRMRSHGVDVRNISTALRSNNVNVSGGWIKEGGRKLIIEPSESFRPSMKSRTCPWPDKAFVSETWRMSSLHSRARRASTS